MIVFDLKCAAGHVFEAWFGSSEAYATQRRTGRVACPLCGDSAVEKAVMAPSIAMKGNRREDKGQPAPLAPAMVKAALKVLAEKQAAALAGSQWVGASFATRARAMHAGEEAETPIHGQTSVVEAKALIEEGVPIAPLPLPVTSPDQVN